MVYGAAKRMSWDAARQLVKDKYFIDLDYAEGEFLGGVSPDDMDRCMTSVVKAETR